MFLRICQLYLICMALKINKSIRKVTKDFNDVDESVLKFESLLIIKFFGKLSYCTVHGFLFMSAIENCYLFFLDFKIIFFACSYIPHLE